MAISDEDLQKLMNADTAPVPASTSTATKGVSDEDLKKMMEEGAQDQASGDVAQEAQADVQQNLSNTQAPDYEKLFAEGRDDSAMGAFGRQALAGLIDNPITKGVNYLHSLSPNSFAEDLTGTSPTPEYMAATPQQRRDIDNAKLAQTIDAIHGNQGPQGYGIRPVKPVTMADMITGTPQEQGVMGYTMEAQGEHPIAGTLGSIVSAPSSYIAPWGKGAMALAKTMFAIGTTEAAIDDLSKEGTLHPVHEVTSGAISAALGVGVEKVLVQPVAKVANKYFKRGSKINPNDLKEDMIFTKDIDPATANSFNFNSLANDLNTKLGLDNTNPTTSLKMNKIEGEHGLGHYSYNTGMVDYRAGWLDTFNEMKTDFKINSGKPAEKTVFGGEKEPNAYSLQYNTEADAFKKLLETKGKAEPLEKTNLARDNKKARAAINALDSFDVALKGPEKYEQSISFTHDGSVVDPITGGPRIVDDNLARGILEKFKGPVPFSGVNVSLGEDLLDTQLRNALNKPTPDYPRQSSINMKFDQPTVPGPLPSELIQAAEQAKLNAKGEMLDNSVDTLSNTGTADEVAALSEMAQGGAMKDAYPVDKFTLQLAQRGGMGPLRAVRAARAIANNIIPYASEMGQKLYPSVGKEMVNFKDPTPEQIQGLAESARSGINHWLSSSERWYAQPAARFEAVFGGLGKVFNTGMRDLQANSDRRVGSAMVDLDKALAEHGIKPGSAEDQMAIGINNKTVDPRLAPANVRNYAEWLSKSLDSIGNEALKTGVWSKAQHAVNTATKKAKGYFPRWVDQDLLGTKAGKEQFVDGLSRTPMSKKSAIQLAENYLGLKGTDLDTFVRTLPSGDKIYMPRHVIEKFWESRGMLQPSYRSKHLDAPRTIPEEFEAALKPFMISDSRGVMSHLYQDAYHRIESAKLWGAKDEAFDRLYTTLLQIDQKTAENARQVYYLGVKDSAAKNTQHFMNLPEAVRRIGSAAKAYEVLKMTFSALGNSTQFGVNGLPHAMGQDAMPLVKRFQAFGKAVVSSARSYSDEVLKESYQRSGAGLQKMLAEATGRYNTAANTMTGSNYGGAMSWVNWFNDPGRYMEIVQQVASEDWNRRVGYFLGKGYVEMLVDQKTKYESMGNRINPKHLESTYKALEEVGIPRDIDPSKMSIELMENASNHIGNTSVEQAAMKHGKIVSDEINFTSNPNDLSLFKQSFFGKLMGFLTSYDFKQQRYVMKHVIGPAKKGNFAPLLAYVGTGAPSGIALTKIQNLIQGDDSEITGTQNMIFAAMRVSALGRMTTIMQAAFSGKASLLAAFTGKMVSDAVDLTVGAAQSAKSQSIIPLEKAAVRVAPSLPFKRELLDELTASKKEADSAIGEKFMEDMEDQKSFIKDEY